MYSATSASLEAHEPDMSSLGLAHQLSQRRAQRVPQRGIDVTERAHHEQAAVRQLAATTRSSSSEGSSAACRSSSTSTSGRTWVALRGTSSPHRRDENAPPPTPEPAAPAGRESAHAALGAAEQDPRPHSELRAQLGGIALKHVRGVIAPRASRRGRRRPPSSGRPGPAPARVRLCDQLLGEAALADAGLADEQEQPPAAGEGVIETADQLGQLPRAADACPRGPASGTGATATAFTVGHASAGSCASTACSSLRFAPPARFPAPRPGSCERPGRPAAHPPAGRTDRGRASAGRAGAPCTGARRSGPRAARPLSAWPPSASCASISCSSAATRRSSRRATSASANGS